MQLGKMIVLFVDCSYCDIDDILMECLFNIYILYYFIIIKSKRKGQITAQDKDLQINKLEVESQNSLTNSTPFSSDTVKAEECRSLEAYLIIDRTNALKSTEKHLLSSFGKSSESWHTEESP